MPTAVVPPEMELDRWWAESNPSINHDVRVSRDQILSQQHKKTFPRHGTWTFYHSPICIPVSEEWSVSISVNFFSQNYWSTPFIEDENINTHHVCWWWPRASLLFYYTLLFSHGPCVSLQTFPTKFIKWERESRALPTKIKKTLLFAVRARRERGRATCVSSLREFSPQNLSAKKFLQQW